MDEQEAVIDQLATDQVQSTQDPSENGGAQQSHGMRQLREAYERERQEKAQKELELAEMRAKLDLINQGYSKPVTQTVQEPDYFSDINSMDDDLPSGAQVKKVVGGLASEIKRLQSQLQEAKSHQSTGALTPLERARLKYEDYSRVVNREAIDKYLTNPALRELIDTSPADKQPELAYKIIKGEIDREAAYQKGLQTKATIQTAATKPPSPNQAGRQVPPASSGKDAYRMNISEKAEARERAREDIKRFIRQANSSVG